MNYNFDIRGYLVLNAGLKTHLHDSKLFSFHTWRHLVWCPEKINVYISVYYKKQSDFKNHGNFSLSILTF